MDILSTLKKNVNDEYKIFQEKICKTKYPILGIKIPVLRKICKEMLKEATFEEIINNLDQKYYESILMEGLLIANCNKSYEEKIELITNYLPKIDNWAICDIFCGEAKFIKKNKDSFGSI